MSGRDDQQEDTVGLTSSFASAFRLDRAINTISNFFLLLFMIPLTVIYFILELCISIVSKMIIFLFNKGGNSVSNSLLTNFDGTKFTKVVNPEESAITFIENFNNDVIRLTGGDDESNIGLVKPEFFRGGYTQALQLVKNKGKWLIVYLQDDDHEDCDKLITRVLLTNEFNNILNHDEVIIWGGNVKNSEAYQVSNTLSATRFPFMALLCLTFNDHVINNDDAPTVPLLSVVARIQGYHPVRKICTLFKQRISKYEPKLKILRLQYQQIQKTKLLRKQQDLELERTLFADQIKRQRQLQIKLDQMNLARFIVKSLQRLTSFENIEVVTRIPSNNFNEQVYRRISVAVPHSGERIIRFYRENCLTDEIYNVAYLVINDFIRGNANQEINFEKLEEFLSGLKISDSSQNLELQRLKTIHDMRTLESYLSEFSNVINSNLLCSAASSSNSALQNSFQMNYKFTLYNAYPRTELQLAKQIKDVEFIQRTGNLFLEKYQEEEDVNSEDN